MSIARRKVRTGWQRSGVVFLMGLGMALSAVGQVQDVSELATDRTFTVRGFGTLGVAYNKDGHAGYRRDATQPEGVRNRLNTEIDSRVGLQLDARLTSSLTATVQAVSRYRYDGSWRPELTWGFLHYSPNPDIDIRLGRLGWDVYMLADSRAVGYSYLWVRPPVEYYGNLQLERINGADVVFRRPLGNGALSVKLYAGDVDSRIPQDRESYSDLSGSWLLGGHVSHSGAHWRSRLSYTRFELRSKPRGRVRRDLAMLEEHKVPGIAALMRELRQDAVFHFASAGVAYDRGPLQGQLMYSHVEVSDKALPSFHTGYVSIGYRVGSWTPYMTVSAFDTTRRGRGLALPPELPPLGFDTAALGLTEMGQHSLTLGARVDWVTNVALKFQVDRIRVRHVGSLSPLWDQAHSAWDGRATVFSATLDFIF